MSDTADREVVEIITDEPSRVHHLSVPVPPSSSGEHMWRWAALVLTTLGAAVLLAGGLGRALYVTRTEYTSEVQNEAVARESMRGTLERLDKTLTAQAEAFRQLAGEVQAIKIDLAVTKKR